MTPPKRQPYRAQAQKLQCLYLKGQRLSNTSKDSLQQVEEDEQQLRHVQQQIENIVRRSVQTKKLHTKKYYFVMVNYFVKDIYIPAELAIAQFSLQGGVHRIFHTLINPGCNFNGSLCMAQEHAKETHQLPLPPNALGNTDLEEVYADILRFLGPEPACLFTLQDAIPIATGVLKFLNTHSTQIDILPIEYLFFKMKHASREAAMLSPPESIHVTNSLFNLDPHECLPNIACTFHEERFIPKHCAKSYVTRWAFTFARNICSDLAIKMYPNRHMPETIEINPSENENSSNENENKTSIIKEESTIDDEITINPFVFNAINDLDLDDIFDDDDFLEFNNRYRAKETEASIENQTVNVALEQAEPVTLAEELSAPSPPLITAQELNDCEFFSRQREKQLKHKAKLLSENAGCTSKPKKIITANVISEHLGNSSNKKEKNVSRINGNHRSRKRIRSITKINTTQTVHLSNPTTSKKSISTIVTTGANLLTSPSQPRPIPSLCNYTYNTYNYESFTTYECSFEPRIHFEPQQYNQYEYCQPVRRPDDLRHRLQMRSHFLSQNGYGHRIQRRYDLEPRQMHMYSNEQFKMCEYNSSAWGGYESQYEYYNYYYD